MNLPSLTCHCCVGRAGHLTECLLFPQVVDKNTEEAEIIMQYVKNTHAATHNTYTLEVEEVSWTHTCTYIYTHTQTYTNPTKQLSSPDLQNSSRGRVPKVPALQGPAQPAAAVARLTHHQLRRHPVPGSAHRSPRGPCGQCCSPRSPSKSHGSALGCVCIWITVKQCLHIGYRGTDTQEHGKCRNKQWKIVMMSV